MTAAPAIAAAVSVAVAAVPAAAATTVAERATALRRLADALDRDGAALAALCVAEIGTPCAQARALHVGSAVGCLRAYAELAERHRFVDVRPAARGGTVEVRRAPVGVAVGIVPWNVPIYLACQKLGAAVAAGCPLVLKPSPENIGAMTRFDALLDDLPLPPGMLQAVIGDADVGRALVADPRVAKISFTGSTAAGRAVAMVCAERSARITLELGGKSAAILLDDFDPDDAGTMRELFLAMLQNNGQVCGAQSRVLVPQHHAARFTAALAALVDGLQVDRPTDPATDIGPLATAAHVARVQTMIDRALAGSVHLIAGGHPVPDGRFVAPRLFAVDDAGIEIARDEVFGPVVTVLTYRDEADAIALANDSPYGLSGSVWSVDPDRAVAVARGLRTGTVGINSKRILDFAAPFGGWRASGIGRELGPEGIDAYLETTAILVPDTSTITHTTGERRS